MVAAWTSSREADLPGLPGKFGTRLDSGTRRLDGGRVLLGGSPLRLLRLSKEGAELVEDAISGSTVASLSKHHPSAPMLLRRLVAAGVLQPVPPPPTLGPEHVSIVIPVRDRAARITETLRALEPPVQVVVVDDASSDGSGEVAAATGARVLLHRRAAGPAAARNTGLRAVTGDVVVFLDSDCTPAVGWLEPLLAHFNDPAVVAVAPRIVGPVQPSGTALDRYEAIRSPLDMGPLEGNVMPRSRISYVPAAALAVRRDAALAAGGFDEAMHFGEDVDLVWRLIGAGGVVRYEPQSRVHHDHRTRLLELLARRFGYGSSAGPLARRHPGRIVPVAVSSWSAAAWLLVASGHPGAGVSTASVTTALLPRKLRALEHPWRESLRLAGLGHLGAGRLLADAVVRAWLPLAVAGSWRSRRVRRAVVAAAVVPRLVQWLRVRPRIDPLRFTVLGILDDAAYCTGVWAGCVQARTIVPLMPDLSNWPGRRHAVDDVATST